MWQIIETDKHGEEYELPAKYKSVSRAHSDKALLEEAVKDNLDKSTFKVVAV